MSTFTTRSLCAAIVTFAAAGSADAQGLANRVSSASDGPVQFTFAARDGVCGNGRTYISTGNNSFYGTINNSVSETLRNDPCVEGPVRVVLGRADRNVISVETFVGPASVEPGATDLGTVPAREANEFLLSLAARLDGRPGKDAIFPAMLADSANAIAPLLAIGRDKARPSETRRSALSWLGREVERDASAADRVTTALVALAKDQSEMQAVRSQAVSVLARLDRGHGIPALSQLATASEDMWLGKQALGSLAKSGDPRARQTLRTAVQRADLPEDMLVTAIRALGREYATGQDLDLIRGLYGKLDSEKARSSVISTVSELGGSENTRWLLGIVRQEEQPIALRRAALRGAAKSGATTPELVALYTPTMSAQMKESLISLYSERGDEAAVDKLLSIVKTEEDRSLRRRTISRLSKSDDPRVKQALVDIVER